MSKKIKTKYPVWFNSTNFEQCLATYKGKPNLKFLQIGVFTGDASVWLLKQILIDPSSVLIDVDTWEGSPNEEMHMQMDFEDVYETYKKKVEPYDNVRSVRNNSSNFLKYQKPDTYDFIYIDGDHTARVTYDDGIGAWNCLVPGGVLAFDDYHWGDGLENQSLAPRPGIDRFLEEHIGQYKLLVKNAQVWLKKNDN